ncbi:hypothetical protein [Streptomyces sp. NPDC002133]|uniref:hypothetical protein n=1 Tax=Streptomyces sp. NPDC002133 TaxID=3154409 RepID=UPI003331C4A3
MTALATSAIADSGTDLSPVDIPTDESIAAEDALAVLPESSGEGNADPPRCDNPYKEWYEITSKKAYHVPSWWNGTKFKDGPGGTMVVKVEKAGKISAEISGGIETEAKAIIAKAKVKVDVKIGAEIGVTVGHEYRRDIARGKYGHLQYGSWGYQITRAKYATSADRCGKTRLKSGSGKLPTTETGWRYWETSS